MNEIVSFICDLGLAPQNQPARDFYDLHWSEILALEDSRQMLEYFHYRRLHPHLTRRYNVHKSNCNCLPLEIE